MKQFTPVIITASAGTGKTYRLALEYIRLVLDYYRPDRRPEFDLDSILVLTFTRKATAEIKDRIQKHLKLLCSTKETDQAERNSLIRQIKGSENATLSQTEMGVLDSVNLAIMSDRRLLQVMTIDSYINSIFRNIVRPLRSIGDIEIDTLAVEKRMPFLLSELMTDELKAKVDKLLRRRVKRSLDGYSEFFASLIYNRWLYQMIIQNPQTQLSEAERRQRMDETWKQLCPTLEAILNMVQMIASAKGEPWETHFGSTIKRLFHRGFPIDPPEFIAQLKDLLPNSARAMTFFDNVKDLKLYDGRKINSRNKHHDQLTMLKEQLREELSEHFYYRFFLPEQHEILQIWASILEQYDQLIYRYKNMTYDDISWFTLQTLFEGDPPAFPMDSANEANEFYQFLTHRSRFILIDEFQDTSLMQFQILKPIIDEVCSGYGSKDFGGLIVVGDEKQSIFGWRGGERDLLINLKNLIPSIDKQAVREDKLDKSYRTSATLMDLINSIFGDKELHTYLGDEGMIWPYSEVESAVEKPDFRSFISLQAMPFQTRGNDSPSLDDLRKHWVEKYLRAELNDNGDEHPNKQDKPKSIAILCRTNNELVKMQSILDETGITSVYQPNAELPDHRLVQPLISFMRWIAYGDWTDWLTWLRSDYIRIKPALLKDVIDWIHSSGKDDTPPGFTLLGHHLQKLYNERPEAESSPHSICQNLVLKYLDRTQLGERDQLNLDAFLELAKDFELDGSTADTSIPSFLQYLEDLREQDKLKQISIEGSDGVQLLTIHKSKGLQFDSVFVFYNLSGKGGGPDDSLDWFVSYQGEKARLKKDYFNLDEYALSYHYGKVLEYSQLGHLHQNKRKKEYLEEMNNLYVALTRAKTTLHVLFAYEASKDWDEYYPEKIKEYKKGKTKRNMLPLWVCDAGIRWVSKHGKEGEVIGPELEDAQKQADKNKPQMQLQADALFNTQNLAQALDFATCEPEALKEEDKLSPATAKQKYLQDRDRLLGEMRHDYLSHLIYNTESEQETALRRTMNTYASLLPKELITGELEQLKANIARHEWLFDRRWDKIFNEIELVIADKRMRLDRLMIDTQQKRVKIVDYKSGKKPDSTQLDSYQQALQQLPVFTGYQIDTEYLSLK